MTIIDESHPKAHLLLGAARSQPQDSSSSSRTESDIGFVQNETLPSYDESFDPSRSNAQAGPSHRTASTATRGYEPESIDNLNPEARKKLAAELNERPGLTTEDYGIHQPTPAPLTAGSEGELPSFSTSEQAHRAQYRLDSKGNVTSYDAKLNASPSALLRFLRLHAESPPSLILRMRGSHKETKTEYRTHKNHHTGHTEMRPHRIEELVEDFEFWIDASEWVEKGLGLKGTKGLVYAIGEWEPAFRGSNRRTIGREQGEGNIRLDSDQDEGDLEIGTARSRTRNRPSLRRTDHHADQSHGKWSWISFRKSRALLKQVRTRAKQGLPLFVHPESLLEVDAPASPLGRTVLDALQHPPLLYRNHLIDLVENHSTFTSSPDAVPIEYEAVVPERLAREEQVRQVVEDYCQSGSIWKELKVEKEVYGWDLNALEQGIKSILSSEYHTQYPSGQIEFRLDVTPRTILIRPENEISQILSAPWYLKIVLSILLIYPVVWVLSWFCSPRFHQLRVAYPLTRYRRIPSPQPATLSKGATSESATFSDRNLVDRHATIEGFAYSPTNPESQDSANHLAIESMRTRGETGPIQLIRINPTPDRAHPAPGAPDESSSSRRAGAGPRKDVVLALVGLQETQAIERWEQAIRQGVRQRLRGGRLNV